MTHLTMEQLLALREPGVEPGTASQREHMDPCETCRLELERLEQRSARLRALPTLRPARDQWPRVAARLNAARRQRRQDSLRPSGGSAPCPRDGPGSAYRRQPERRGGDRARGLPALLAKSSGVAARQ